MNSTELVFRRLQAQQLLKPCFKSPEELLAWMAAVQAQDYPGAKWSLGLRLPGSTDPGIEQAIGAKKIVRSWVMRGTLHFVASADLPWLLELLAPALIASNRRRYAELGLDEPFLARSSELIVRSLQASGRQTRRELLQMLEAHGLSTAGQRGVYMLQRASLEGLICQGTVRANNPTFFLLQKTGIPAVPREEALARLALRYFESRAPASLPDFTWWSGLSARDARAGLEAVKPQFQPVNVDGKTYWFSSTPMKTHKLDLAWLLPGFDEFLLSYKDRSASLSVPHYNRRVPTNGMLPGTLVIDGLVKGTWKRVIKGDTAVITLNPFEPLSASELEAFSETAERWGEFHGLRASISSGQ